jgi:hypothetical protein
MAGVSLLAMQPNSPWGPPPYGQPPAQHYAAAQPPFGPVADPYGYRQNVFVPYGAAAGPLVGPTLRKVKLALGIVQLLLMFAGIGLMITGGVLGEDGGPLLAIGGGALVLWYLFLFGYAVVNMVWLHQFWSWIPPEQRYTNMWKKYISPGTAVGFMFIPYFNIYWMFVVYLGLAEIMERLRVQYPSSKEPLKTMAILTIVIPLVFFPAAPFLQFFFSKRIEEMAAEMNARRVHA